MSRAAVRVLIVGCGRIAGGFNEASQAEILTHVLAYRDASAEVVGCCDIDASIAKAFASRWQVLHHGADLDALLATVQPDVVSVSTPPDAQEAVINSAIAASCVQALLVEKPFGRDGASAARIVTRLRHWNRPVTVNFFRAFDPCYRHVSTEAKSGRLGVLRHVVARYYGAARTNASHLVERILDIVDGRLHSPQVLSGGDTESPMFLIPFNGGGEAAFLPSSGLPYAPFELDLLFERARIRIIDSEGRLERFEVVPDPHYPGYTTLAASTPGIPPSIASFAAPFRAIVGVVRGERAADFSIVERGAAVTSILDQVLLQEVSRT
jgi:hypothetical protein